MKRIICVDDDPALRNVFSLIFARAGYDIVVCPDGEAIVNNKIQLPDIYILDKQLSGFSGLDICLFLKSDPVTRLIPVIIISASPTLATDSNSVGADGYLEKPFKLKDILDLVESCTANRVLND